MGTSHSVGKKGRNPKLNQNLCERTHTFYIMRLTKLVITGSIIQNKPNKKAIVHNSMHFYEVVLFNSLGQVVRCCENHL